ncbi:MAG TPA: TIGR01458 family HAD-type hydrolase [Gemmatimonadales bacterium]|nr:TIGR01458 family HAD-type hydrolase [Gemmatimonadales bacterium]
MTLPAGYLLDLDGTLYSGGAAVPGAPETLARLRQAGVPFRFVTNTTSRPRAGLAERLRGYGFEAGEEEIFTPVTAAAELLRGRGVRVVAPFLPPAALDDLDGFTLAGGLARRAAESSATRPEAVVVGDLAERWTYGLMQEAFEYLLRGAIFVALSRDRYWLRDGALALDAGPFVAGLEYAASRTALVAGKPSAAFFDEAVASLGLDAAARHDVVMVGDDLWSDVRGAQEAGYRGWIVRTGKFREDVLRESGIAPDRVIASVAALGDALPARSMG